VVVKSFKRCGWLSRFNRERYLRTFKTRSRKEFEFLFLAAEAGVPVPAPVAFASRGSLVYRAWLITGAIKEAVPFVRLCQDEKDKALALMPEISRHIRLLIQQGIFHVDLHPGNIIVGKDDKPYIIDFDKACQCSFTGSELAAKYQRRWIRAVRKYRLPDVYGNLSLTEIDSW
jgi:3-deoxy-D-manno-octulosonic acid kinase